MLKIVDHILAQEILTKIRKKGVDSVQFRSGVVELGRLISYEFINTMERNSVKVETPLGFAKGIKVKNKKDVVVISILRAAIPLVDGIMRVFPEAQCGVVGAWREDEPPFKVKMDYMKIPNLDGKIIIVADPMLATGNTMNTILKAIKKFGTPKRLVLFNIISTDEGIAKVINNHPEIEIYTCSIEKELSKEGYIIPGLGDAGDLAFGKPN
ncbi:MAG: uracil phosphoribosyltransferase [Methanobacterium sp. BRmetb2]|nr:MAG: uracil phosphoribosyltransferase [Methanobacterium sp. BRmetb2]MCC7564575.1 uracil phosphoribosyltransferase [Methanobacterium sp.]